MQLNTIILLMGIAGTGKKSIGKAIVNQDNSFRLAHHHDWMDPVLKLWGSDESVWWNLGDAEWSVLNQTRDVILNTIAEAAPRDANFVITNELLANNPWHQEFFDEVSNAAEKRSATLIPVRLICDLDELIRRVKSSERKNYYKTRDVELIKKRYTEESVFYSSLSCEYTLDTTQLAPSESAEKILNWLEVFHVSCN